MQRRSLASNALAGWHGSGDASQAPPAAGQHQVRPSDAARLWPLHMTPCYLLGHILCSSGTDQPVSLALDDASCLLGLVQDVQAPWMFTTKLSLLFLGVLQSGLHSNPSNNAFKLGQPVVAQHAAAQVAYMTVDGSHHWSPKHVVKPQHMSVMATVKLTPLKSQETATQHPA